MRIVDALILTASFLQEAVGSNGLLTLSIRQRWILGRSSYANRRLLMRLWRSDVHRTVLVMAYPIRWKARLTATGRIFDAVAACQKTGIQPEIIKFFVGTEFVRPYAAA